MENPLDKYIREHSTPFDGALEWIEKQTNIRTNFPQMLSGPVQGRLLTMLVQVSGARRVLEIGTFTGYSAVCLAMGLPEDGHVDTLEINDELAALAAEGWRRAGVTDKVTLHIGDALDTLRRLASEGAVYDFVYIDANKREYLDYYHLVMDILRPGGLLLADDVMLGGKVYDAKVPTDKQTRGLVAFNDFVAGDPRVEVVMLPIRDGLSLIRKK